MSPGRRSSLQELNLHRTVLRADTLVHPGFRTLAFPRSLWLSPCKKVGLGRERPLMKVALGNTSEASVSQLALLHRISGIVSSDMSLRKMLDELIALVAGVTACDACLVYLLDSSSAEIVLCASQLPHAGEIGNIRMKIGEGVTGWVAKHQSVVALSSRASKDPRFKSFPSLPEDTYEAFLSVPLISSGQMIGVINVHHLQSRTHVPEEVALLSYVAEQMGGAIAKARLAARSQAAVKKVELLAVVGHTIASEAYLDMRGESRRLRRPMRDLAEAIVLAEELHRKGEKKELV